MDSHPSCRSGDGYTNQYRHQHTDCNRCAAERHTHCATTNRHRNSYDHVHAINHTNPH